MGQVHRLNITLSDEAVQFVRNKVSSGEYASESDVIHQGLEALQSEASERERWEHEVLTPAHDRLIENPSSTLSFETVESNLQARRIKRSNAS